ncbi:MAG: biopolymer transporter ExbD [Phycisphaeraceae bacterium]|nr:biopolymer transporter ExbD [Phycisphaeraceae bacterium]
MRPVRRHDLSPRVDLLPLIDVVFLLLTFFMFAIVVRPEMLGLTFAMMPITGPDAARPTIQHVLTLDIEGRMTLGGQVVELEDLRPAFEALREREPDARLYVILEDGGRDAGEVARPRIDRLPLWIQIGAIAREVGLRTVQVSGPRGAADQLPRTE